jgi:hypothetical protein
MRACSPRSGPSDGGEPLRASVWVYLGCGAFVTKGPIMPYWILLDLLGFSRQNLDFSMGYRRFSAESFLALSPHHMPVDAGLGLGSSGLFIGQSLKGFRFSARQSPQSKPPRLPYQRPDGARHKARRTPWRTYRPFNSSYFIARLRRAWTAARFSAAVSSRGATRRAAS